ncbi:MAG: hypothetical protein AVDCRST_MAG17-1830 [uncultured Solirubrobacterales bacterium]|uniref:Uncharacterized protein n=1 Tax=uncultured Solirubrobacterales bacterium TaxID=768556 RepID=A0A6J4SXE0_9ACTN|nr:MAG: hypothetical protein AVDCRST_MAG17-1830 [uncultured Solirubrobacterales bacterium]
MRRRKTVAASAVAVLTLAAGTTAIAAPGGPLGLFEDRDDRRAEQAQALGEKLGVAPARVERALDEVHRERHEERRDEMAKALAERLNVPQADAERALDRAFAAKRDRREGPPEPGVRGERGGTMAQAIASELDKSPAAVRRALTEIRRERFEARLAEGVEEGRITEEQAKEIREQAESGRGRGFGPPHVGSGHGPGGGGPSGGGPEGFGGPGGIDDPGGPAGPPGVGF